MLAAPHFWHAALTLLMLLSCGAAALADQTGTNYRLAPGDRLKVTVIAQPEVSGDFTVDGGGDIIIPLLGSVHVSDLTVSEIQQRLIDGLSKGLLNQPAVYVRIAEMRPISVLGDVKTPGSYPYRYGAIVKTAVAQAGGYGSPEKTPAGAVSDFLQADERVHVLGVTRNRLIIRKARLEAQLAGAKTFAAPGRQADSPEDSEQIVAEEQAALDIQNGSFEKQVDALRSQKPQLLAENEAIDEQIVSEKKQVDLIQQQIETYAELSEKGLGKASSMLELKLAEAGKQSNVWRLEADRSRLRIAIMEFDIKLLEIESAYKKQVLAELQDIRQRLSETEAMLPSAREIRTSRLQVAGSSVYAILTYSIRITRSHGAAASTIDATDTTLLEPGDIVEIRSLRPAAASLSQTDQAPQPKLP